ncbi:MAG: arginine--tRNA ligase [Flavobacteriaceae bacterium]|nr:arginine--tRNA ligase [Flavobacteriaceae bacterium]
MDIKIKLQSQIINVVEKLYNKTIETVDFQETRKGFEGDITVVIFSLLHFIKGNPLEIGTKIGEYLVKNEELVTNFNVVKGFLNISIANAYYLNFFYTNFKDTNFGFKQLKTTNATMVEYSSPNTNKPLHLGHIRNNLLGYSVAEISKAAGKKVYKTQIINDRGIHICKSMLAWERYGKGETPKSTALKGDKLVGKYYVKFDQEYKKEIAALVAKGIDEKEAKKQAPILLEAQQMLQKWETGDKEVVKLWKTMNQWVYDGFAVTYKNLGVDFDTLYYESNTYLLGKEFITQGLKSGVFYKKEDASVWCSLTEEGLDEKIVLRSDGTSVYMTQDIGTAIQRLKDYPDINSIVYTVGNEQDYHFKVLFLILKKLGFDWAKNLYHLSYGMVDLPEGKMKSREGTVVDADDLIAEMTNSAREIAQELGKLEGYTDSEKENLYKTIGLGALKYYILKVDPKKRILFNPKESIDFNGNTGPFIQYTYARIQSILRKADFDFSKLISISKIQNKEKLVLKQLQQFPNTVQLAAKNYSPAVIANYTYDLVKEYNSFYQSIPILNCEDLNTKIFRTQLSQKVADTIKLAFSLLGISVPERM